MDDPNTMQAAPEMDALVDEYLFGQEWYRSERVQINGKWFDVPTWIERPRTPESPAAGSEPGQVPPCYSTDIAAAWPVVEALEGRGFCIRLTTPFLPGEPYTCGATPQGTTGWNGRPDHLATAPTAPLAICRAALAVVQAGERE